MKSRLVKILGVVVTLATLTALAAGLAAVPASAAPGALAWAYQNTPSIINNVMVQGIQASAFGVSPDGKTVFLWDAANLNMYVSTDGGVTFPAASVINITTAAPVAGTTAFMVISPKYATDKTAVLVQSSSGTLANNHVWWTTNGGTTWVDVANTSLLASPGFVLGDYISSADLNYYWQTNVLNIVIGVAGPALTTSNVLMFASGGFSWTEFGALANPVIGVKFSPNELSDAEIMAAFTSGGSTYLTSSIGGLNFATAITGVAYPAVVVVAAAATSAQIATASDYMANTSANILVGLAGAGASSGLYLVNGRTAGNGGTSTAEAGRTGATFPILNLVEVGPAATATAYYSLGAQTTSGVWRSTTFTAPATATWTGASKAPTGTAAAVLNTLIDAGGTSIFAATSGTTPKDCALSVSTDGGVNFQQTAFIDVVAASIGGVNFKTLEVVDANTMFVIMNNPAAPATTRNSLFKTTNGGTSWMRILTGPATMTLVSASPAYATDATVVVADTAATIVQKSVDGGNSFIPYGVLALPTALKTIAGGVFYTGAASVLYTSGAFVGATGITGTVMSIAVNPMDKTGATIAVGTNAGTVYQSTNSGTSFTEVGTGPATANITVAYGPNGTLYAADSTAGLYNWNGTAWTLLQSATPTGLVVTTDNTVYMADSTGGTSVYRTLDPTDSPPAFQTMNFGGAGYLGGDSLIGLAVVSGKTADTVYGLENAGTLTTVTGFGYTGAILAFSDTMIAPPAITAPQNNANITDQTGTTYSWPAVTGAARYEVFVDGTSVAVVAAPTTSWASSTTAYTAGTTHSWYVRVDSVGTGAAASFWSKPSATATFTLSLASPAPTVTSSYPAAGQTDVDVNPSFSWPSVAGATSYDFVIAEELGNADKFAIIDYGDNTPINAYKLKEDLKYNTQYWWRVRAVSGTTTSAWVVSFFTTEAMPVTTTATTSTAPITVNPVTPTVTVTNVMPTQPVVTPTVINQGSTQQVIPTYLLWLVIVVGAVLVIAVIVLIVRTRRIS